MASRRVLRRAVHGHPRPEHRQRRAAGDPIEPRLLVHRPAMGRRRLRDPLRRLPHGRRPGNRSLRRTARARRRPVGVCTGIARRRARADARRAHRGARLPGPERRGHGGGLARRDHLQLPRRPGPASRDRALGGDERRGRCRRRPPRRCDHRHDRLALGPADQHPDRHRRGRRRRCRAERRRRARTRGAAHRRRGRAHTDRRADRARLRDRRCRLPRLDRARRGGAGSDRARPPRELRRHRVAPRRAARPATRADAATPSSKRRRPSLQRRPLPHVVRELALPAAGARALAAARRSGLPADGAHDHDRRAPGGSPRRALRRPSRPHVRAHDDDGRTAPARPDRDERQRDRLRHPAGRPRCARHRSLDRPVDHRGHAGRAAGAGGPGVRAS